MPAWIEERAKRLAPEMEKTYGPEKAKQVAYAVATQQAYATGQAPKMWHGKPFGTPEGRRKAKQKYDEPSKLQKTALWPSGGAGKSASAIIDAMMGRTPEVIREKVAGRLEDAANAADYIYRQKIYDDAVNRIVERLMSTPQGPAGRAERMKYLTDVAQGKRVHPLASGIGQALLRGALGGAAGYGLGSLLPSSAAKSDLLDPRVLGAFGAGVGVLSGIGHGLRELLVKREMKNEAQRFLDAVSGRMKTASIDQGSQVPVGSTNPNREILRPTVTPSVMTSSQVPLTPPSGLGNTNTSIAAAGPTDDEIAEFFKRHPNPPDDVLHRWAISRGWDPEEVEGRAYRLLTTYAQFRQGGRANEEGLKPEDVSPDQLRSGTEVEKEHTSDPATAQRIAMDHLAELPDYYTRLDKMEEGGKKAMNKKGVLEGFKKLFKNQPRRKPVGEIIDLADEAASRAAAKSAALQSVIPHFLSSLYHMQEQLDFSPGGLWGKT